MDRYLIGYTLAWYGRRGWDRTTQRLSHVFPETLPMALQAAHRNTGSAFGKHLPVFLKSSFWKPFSAPASEVTPSFLNHHDIGEYKLSWNWGQ